MKRIVVWVVIGLVALIAVLAVIPFAVDLNKYHDAILARIKPYVNRQVDFTGVRLTILSGLGAEIEGLRVLDDPAFAKDVFLSADGVQLKVALLPLLTKQIKIRAVVLKTPVINVVRAAGGMYNFESIVKPRAGEGKGQARHSLYTPGEPGRNQGRPHHLSGSEARQPEGTFRGRQDRPQGP